MGFIRMFMTISVQDRIIYGIDIKSVSEMLGHADITTTLRLYVHPSMDSKRQAVQKISFLGGVA